MSEELRDLLILAVAIIIITGIAVLVARRLLPTQFKQEFDKRQGAIDRFKKQIPGFADRPLAEQQAIAKKVALHPFVVGYVLLVLGLFVTIAVTWQPANDFINNGSAKGVGFVVAAVMLPITIFPALFIQKKLAEK
jgi:hypothetical protein